MITSLLFLLEAVQIRIDKLQDHLDTLDLDDSLIRDAPRLVNVWSNRLLIEKRAFLRRVIRRIEFLPGRAQIPERLVIESQH